MQGNAVISIPAVKHCFFLEVGHRACLVEWALSVVGLACGMEVE